LFYVFAKAELIDHLGENLNAISLEKASGDLSMSIPWRSNRRDIENWRALSC